MTLPFGIIRRVLRGWVRQGGKGGITISYVHEMYPFNNITLIVWGMRGWVRQGVEGTVSGCMRGCVITCVIVCNRQCMREYVITVSRIRSNRVCVRGCVTLLPSSTRHPQYHH